MDITETIDGMEVNDAALVGAPPPAKIRWCCTQEIMEVLDVSPDKQYTVRGTISGKTRVIPEREVEPV